MSWRELVDWRRFDAYSQPLPDQLADLHHALLSAYLLNTWRSAESAPIDPLELLVIRERTPPTPKPPEGSEVERQMKSWRGG